MLTPATAPSPRSEQADPSSPSPVRGDIHLVPELPVGQYRKHLQWVKSGFEDIDASSPASTRAAPKPPRPVIATVRSACVSSARSATPLGRRAPASLGPRRAGRGSLVGLPPRHEVRRNRTP